MRPAPTSPRRGPRTERLIPRPEPPTRHPRRASVLHVGDRLTVRFSAVAPDGAALARFGSALLSVPFGVPGEDAVVEVTRGGRRGEGRLVALLRKSPDVTAARCPHFGRCGGCQWQHLVPDAQRRLKTRLVKDVLKDQAGVRRDLVAETAGGDAWAYRNVLRAEFSERDGVAIVGFHAGGSPRVLDIAACPVQHPANEAILRAARHAVRALNLPVYSREQRTGLVRGVLGLTSFATGEALFTLSTARPLPDSTALVHAVLDRVPGLVGILHTVQPHPTLELLGPRLRLLWGRDSVEEEIAGFRLRLRPTTDLPANPRALSSLVEAVVRAAAAVHGETVLDLDASSALLVLALAGTADAALGVAPTRRAMLDAREAAAANGVTNVAFYTRRPPAVLAHLASRVRRPAVVITSAHGPGLDPQVVHGVAHAAVPRVVYIARSLAVCARDLLRWRQAGYVVCGVQPVDLLPQTSHVHCVVALRRVAPGEA